MSVGSLEDLEMFCREKRNARLLGLINRLKYSDSLEMRIYAANGILRTLRRKGLAFDESLLREILSYIQGGRHEC
jgi:hypothetical protein